ETPRLIVPSGRLILVVCWTDDAAGAPLRALKETAEADAYATSLHEAAEIAVDAARGTGLELTPSLQRGAAAQSNITEVSRLKVVPQPFMDSPIPTKNRKTRTGKGSSKRTPDKSGSAD